MTVQALPPNHPAMTASAPMTATPADAPMQQLAKDSMAFLDAVHAYNPTYQQVRPQVQAVAGWLAALIAALPTIVSFIPQVVALVQQFFAIFNPPKPIPTPSPLPNPTPAPTPGSARP